MRRISTAGVLFAALAVLIAGSAQAAPATEIRGSYVNNVGCVPRDVKPHADPTKFDVTCYVGSTYTGGLVGHTAGHMRVTVDTVTGNMSGTADEWFYGRYPGDDGSYGGIHFTASFSIDGKTNSLRGTGKIVGGTCSFTGSKGTLSFDGFDVYGGFIWQLTRPNPKPVSSPTCNPIDPVPVP